MRKILPVWVNADVLLHETGNTQPEIAKLTRSALSKLGAARQQWRERTEIEANQWAAGKNMTLAEEKALLAKFADAAGAGELPNISQGRRRRVDWAPNRVTARFTIYGLAMSGAS